VTDEEAARHAADEVGKLYRFLTIVAIVGIALIVMAFFGSLTARRALKRGHTPRRWFWIGFFLPLIGLIALYVVKPGPGAQAVRRSRTSIIIEASSIVGFAAAGFLVGWLSANWRWGVFWAVVFCLVPVLGRISVSIIRAEQVWTHIDPHERRRRRTATLVRVGVVAAAAGVGYLVGGGWRYLWACVAGLAGIAELMVASVITDQPSTPDPENTTGARPRARLLVVLGWTVGVAAAAILAYWVADSWRPLAALLAVAVVVGTRVASSIPVRRPVAREPGYEPHADRPPSPRRSITLVPALLIMVFGFWLGGVFADAAGGVVWGVIASVAAIGALWAAKARPTLAEAGIVMAGLIASTVLTRIVLPDYPETLTANRSLLMAVAWLPAAVAGAFLVWRRTRLLSRGVTVVLGWIGAGVLALPAALSFGILKPLASWIGEPDPWTTTTYAFIGVVVALVGGAFLLSGLSGLNALATVSTVLFITAYAGAEVGFTIPGLVRNFTNLNSIAKKMWPPDFQWAIGTGSWWWIPSWDFGSATKASPLIETFRIAIVACLLGVTLAVPLALRASKITAIRGSDYWFNKGIMNTIRTIPDLFWAMIFATSVGIGPFAGALALIFFSLAIMAKLLSETVDAVDPRPIEAARATGSHHWPAIRASVWPQVLPNYVAYALYIFEINIRASVVLGIVGAGGIGRVLEAQRSFYRFDRVLAIVLVIFVIVFLIEQASVALRRRLV
jgi:phosphonate transport system permease protein